jgi:hypothetical protein
MAESQGSFDYNRQALVELQTMVSPGRFARYQSPATDAAAAFQWYLYNARLAKSLLFPLHVFEISLRNRFDHVLSADYGSNWPWNAAFLGELSPDGNAALARAIQYSVRKKPSPTCHDVVAELTLDFWSNLFRPAYARAPWTARFSSLFPHANGMTVRDVQLRVTNINSLRNRIAHHEPIFDDAKLVQHYNDILALLAAQEPVIQQWVKRHATFNRMQRTKPSASGILAPTVGDQCDRAFLQVLSTHSLAELGPQPCIISTGEGGAVDAIIGLADVASYVVSTSASDGGLIDLSDHQLHHVIKRGKLLGNFIEVDEDFPLSEMASKFKSANKATALVRRRDDNAILGYIARSHRRY